jgi:hypothetical protein
MLPTGACHVDTVSMVKAQVTSRNVFARGLTVTPLGDILPFILSNNLVPDDVIPLLIDD